MKNTNTITGKIAVMAFLGIMTSCVDSDYDLSKDVDLTINVGEGLSLPLGSTEKIMLTELIDPEDSDIISTDAAGFYSIEKGGSIDATEVKIDELDPIDINPGYEAFYYDLNFDELTKLENLEKERDKIIQEALDMAVMKATAGTPYQGMKFDELPQQMQDELKAEVTAEVNKLIDDALANSRSRFSLVESIDDNIITFSFKEDGIPQEVKSIQKIVFEKPVAISVGVKIAEGDDKELFELVEDFKLATEGIGGEDFYVEMPEYIVFDDEDRVNGNKLYLDGVAVLNDAKDAFEYHEEFYITALDFTKVKNAPDGFVISNGVLELEDSLYVRGMIRSNDVWLTVEELLNHSFEHIAFIPQIEINDFKIKEVIGVVEPNIDPIKEVVNIDLGEDMDFVYDAEFNFLTPQLFVDLDNGSPVPIQGSIKLIGKDASGMKIEGAEAVANFNIQASQLNKLYFTADGAAIDGYTPVAVKGFKELIKKIPHSVEFEVQVTVPENTSATVAPGSEYSVSGEYEFVLPMAFEQFNIKYTEKIEDVFGDDSDDIFEKISNIETVKINGRILNTVPAALTPMVKAYDASGNLLRNVVVEVDGVIAAGKGYVNGVMAAPVESDISITLSATNGELEKIEDLDIIIEGEGSGVFNENEYIQISELSLSIEEGIEVDLN